MLSPIQVGAVHCSDLKRAVMTAEAICNAQSDPKLIPQTSILLREQKYGSGEGKRWDGRRIPNLTMDKHYERGIYPPLRNRLEKFPGGESLSDLARRAGEVIDHILWPYIWDETHNNAHIVVVSHGILLAELMTALVKRHNAQHTSKIQPRDFRGMRNTAWTKVRVNARVSVLTSLSTGVVELTTSKGIAQGVFVNGREDVDALRGSGDEYQQF